MSTGLGTENDAFTSADGTAGIQEAVDDPGTFWYFKPNADKNEMREPSHRDTDAIVVRGNGNRGELERVY